jgi:hypothetical protein
VIDPQLGQQLADLGGFALFLLTVVAGATGLFRGWIVPGWVYKAERDARKTAEIQALRNAQALEKLRRELARDPHRRRPDGPPDG